MKLKQSPTLILIDCQEGFNDWSCWGGNRNNSSLEQNLQGLLELWRTNQWPVVHIVHHSQDPNSILRRDKSSGGIWPELTPKADEPVMVKRENSAFIGTELEVYLRRNNAKNLVLAGLTTNHCVSTTTRMAGNMGYDVQLVGDACATFDRIGPNGVTYDAQLIHEVCLSDLHGEFCQVVGISELDIKLGHIGTGTGVS